MFVLVSEFYVLIPSFRVKRQQGTARCARVMPIGHAVQLTPRGFNLQSALAFFALNLFYLLSIHNSFFLFGYIQLFYINCQYRGAVRSAVRISFSKTPKVCPIWLLAEALSEFGRRARGRCYESERCSWRTRGRCCRRWQGVLQGQERSNINDSWA